MHATPTTQGPLDRLPASARHLLLALLPVLLTWLGTDVVPALQGRPGVAGVLAVALQAVLLWGTTATRQYGAGQDRPWDTEPDPTADDEPEPDEPTEQDIPEAA